MSQLKLDQILAPLRFTGSKLIVTGSDFLVSGSDVFGHNLSQVHDFTGSVRITGSFTVNGSQPLFASQTASMIVLSSSFAATSSFTPNALVTASVNLNTITFTKGDGSTFPITVNTGSGGGSGVGFPFSGSAVITGSLEVTQGITGSLFGTSSWANTASYAISILDQGYVHTQTVPSTVWTISHNLSTQTPLVTVYDQNYYQVIPEEVQSTNLNTTVVTFPTALSGFAIVSKGSGAAISSSYAISASFANRAIAAEDILVYTKNVTGQQINKGSVVRISGATGDNALIALADWTNDASSANTLGLAKEDIPDQGFGYVMTEGRLIGINTTAFTAGQLIYLGPSGSITGSAPQAPLHAVRLGQVLRVQSNNGSVYVRIDNGFELDELHDVRIITPTTGQVLVRSGSLWTNDTLKVKVNVSGSTSYTVNHGLNEDYPVVQLYDATDREQIIPTAIQSINQNQVIVNIGFLFSGSIVITK